VLDELTAKGEALEARGQRAIEAEAEIERLRGR
jgi:hypothetical protein